MTTRMRYMWARESYLRLSRERYRVFVRKNYGEPKPLTMGKGKWNTYYCADPFLFCHGGANWLFYETLDKTGKGVLGCFKEVDGNWIQQGIILEESCHLSYPQVFEEDGRIYMIPESSDCGRGQVFLYFDDPAIGELGCSGVMFSSVNTPEVRKYLESGAGSTSPWCVRSELTRKEVKSELLCSADRDGYVIYQAGERIQI